MLHFEKYTYIYNFILYYFEYINDLEIIDPYTSDNESDSEYESEIELD